MNDLVLLLQLVLSLLVSIQQNPNLPVEFKSQVLILSQSSIQATEKYLEEQLTQQSPSVPATSPDLPAGVTYPLIETTFPQIVPESIIQPIIKTMTIKLEKVISPNIIFNGDQTRIKLFQFDNDSVAKKLDKFYNVEVTLESNVPLYLPRVNESTLNKVNNYTYSKIIDYAQDRFIVSNIVPETEWTEINLTLIIKSGTFEKCLPNEACVFPELPLSNSVKLIKN